MHVISADIDELAAVAKSMVWLRREAKCLEFWMADCTGDLNLRVISLFPFCLFPPFFACSRLHSRDDR